MNKLKVAVIGAGGISGTHLNEWKRIPQVEVVSISDINLERAQVIARRWDIAQCYSDSIKMLDQEKVDVVDILTPPGSHCTLALAAFEHGCHVLCEKPLCFEPGEAKQMVDAARRAGKLLEVIRSSINTLPMLRLRKAVAMGEIGEVTGLYIDVLVAEKDSWITNSKHWVHEDKAGKLGETLPHLVHMIMIFLGETKCRWLEVRKWTKYDWVAFDELSFSFSSQQGMGSAHLSVASKQNGSSITVYGTKGAVRLDRILGVSTPLVTWDFGMGKVWALSSWGGGVMKQGAQLMQNGLSVLSGKWELPHDHQIHLFISSILQEKRPTEKDLQMLLWETALFDEILNMVEDYKDVRVNKLPYQ